jgi:hypothetical protein
VVAYLVRGFEIETVRLAENSTGETIAHGGYGLNELTYGRADGSIPKRAIESEIVVAYAGPAAEARFLGLEFTTGGMVVPEGFEDYSFGHVGDLQQVQELVAREGLSAFLCKRPHHRFGTRPSNTIVKWFSAATQSLIGRAQRADAF